MTDVTRTLDRTTIYHDGTGGIARIEQSVIDRYESPDGSTEDMAQPRRINIEPDDMTPGDKSSGRAWLSRCADMVERVRPLVTGEPESTRS